MTEHEEVGQKIFFEGQIYDAYLLLIDILSKAKKEMIIIDNYAGKKLFDIITMFYYNKKDEYFLHKGCIKNEDFVY